MMHSSEWTLKYDEPETENVTRGRSPSATFTTEGSSYINVARTTVLHMFCRMTSHWLKIVYRLLRGGETRVSIVCHQKNCSQT